MCLYISEVRIKLVEEFFDGNPLRAYAKIVFNNAIAIQDLRVIQGEKGLFVSMPSRKIMDHCPNCRAKNHLQAPSCIVCRACLDPDRAPLDDRGRRKLYTDVVFPINQRCRGLINEAVIPAYYYEVMLSERPGYICTYDPPNDVARDQHVVLEFALTPRNGLPGAGRRMLVWNGTARTPHLHRAGRFSLRL